MLDFTDLPVRNKTYAGANGSKISVLYNDELYMLKFPAVPANNKDCNKALKRILPKIDMEKIYNIVEETPFVSDLQKEFYKTMLRERKERILDFSYQKLHMRELSKTQER